MEDQYIKADRQTASPIKTTTRPTAFRHLDLYAGRTNLRLSLSNRVIASESLTLSSDSGTHSKSSRLWFGFLTTSSTNRLYSRRVQRLTSDSFFRAATHETERGHHGFCISRSHYTDTDPTSREREATAGIEPRTSSPEVARSTD